MGGGGNLVLSLLLNRSGITQLPADTLPLSRSLLTSADSIRSSSSLNPDSPGFGGPERLAYIGGSSPLICILIFSYRLF